MIQLFLAGAGFILWAITVILFYYSNWYSSITHIESASGFTGYLIFMGVLYIAYKVYILFISPKKELRFGLFSILGFFLLHLLIICGFYSSFAEVLQSPFMNGANASSLVLFFHIISLLLYPAFLVLITRSIGFTLLKAIPSLDWKTEDMRIRVPAEISLGFLIFSTILFGISYFFGFVIGSLITTLIISVCLGIPGLRETYYDITTRKIHIENHDINGSFKDGLNLKLLSIEFGMFFISFVLSVSLINALRPMPIGWDDLGVYMNFPKIMASSHELLVGGGLYVWQLLTATGFLFSYNAAQAFYVNQLGGILSIFAIISVLSYIFQEKEKKSLLALPVLLAAVYYAIPMTVFQQAKDMKLDPALMFFSVSAFGVLFALWKSTFTNTNKVYAIIALAGLLTGFAFGVKVTTLMLLLGGLGLIAYRYLSLSGYLGFFFIFISVFTKFNLWARLNVTITTDPKIVSQIALVSGILGLIGIIWGAIDRKDNFTTLYRWALSSIIFLLGFGLAFSPWMIKNYSESGGMNIGGLLGGSGGTTAYDYTQFHTKKDLATILENTSATMTSSGQTENEDLGRYFGYDTGINNYLKLPANLTFQKNQSGEFTEISYIFLALVPGLLLFVRSRRFLFPLCAGGLLLLMMFYYFIPGTSRWITSYFDLIDLKNGLGYAVMLAMNLVFLIIAHFTIDETESGKKLKDILMFMGIYGFIYMISAFGIVWYGIVIYFGFFIILGLAANIFDTYSTDDERDEDLMSVKLTLSLILFILIGAYFLRSVFPHTWNNLRSAYYNEYKYNVLTQDEAIFAYRSDYITPISTLNIASPQRVIEEISKLPLSPEIQKFFTANISRLTIADIHGLIIKLREQNKSQLKKDAKAIGNILYSRILYPSKVDANTGGIYRIGTFMTYLIDNNRKRYFDDSLVGAFGTYIYDPSPEKTINRMKTMGIKYLLVDLNAATIDRDPRHDLTNRFERLLLTMRAKNLRLIDTDNQCLELAIDEYRDGKLQGVDAFIDIAGTNYESYRTGAVIPRNQKLYNCHNYIITKLNGSGTLSPSLESVKQAIVSNNIQGNPEKLGQLLSSYAGQSWFALFEITDIPTGSALLEEPKILPPPQPIASTGTTLSTGSLVSTGKTNTGVVGGSGGKK